MKNFHLIITGDVQGVGFRSWMKREARVLQIAGWVKNREDGAVEALIQGEVSPLQILLEQVKDGPETSWVKRVDVTEQPVHADLFTFEVIY